MCLLCKAENAKKQFEKSPLQSNLTMFGVVLDRIGDKIASDPSAIDDKCCFHRTVPDPQFFGQLAVLKSMAHTPQAVKAVVHRIL
jgi:hypothetical protein